MHRTFRFYEHLLDRGADVPAPLHARMLPVLAGRRDLLGKIARLENLSDEARLLLESYLDPEIIGALLARDDTDASAVLARVADETDIHALLPLARAGGLPGIVYEHIGRHDSYRIAEALLGNSDAPTSSKLARIEHVVKALDSRRPSSQHSYACSTIGEDRDLAAAVLRRTRKAAVAVVALSVAGKPDPETMRILVERLPVMVDDETADNRVVVELLELLSILELDGGHLRTLRLAAKEQAHKRGLGGGGRWAVSLRDATFLLSANGRRTLGRIAALASERDAAKAAAEIAELTGNSANGTLVVSLVFDAASSNPHLPAKVLLPYMDAIDGDAGTSMVRRWLADGEICHLVDATLEAHEEPWWVEALGDDAGDLLLAVVTAAGGGRVPHWVSSHRVFTGNPDVALSVFPWHRVVDVDDERDVRGENGANALVIDHAVALLRRRFGDDPVKWDLFAGLAEEFEGSLVELVEAAETL